MSRPHPSKFDSGALKEIEESLFRSMGSQGVWATTAAYEEVLDALSGVVNGLRPKGAVAYRFPPVMSGRQIEANGYVRAFPNLLGCVSCLSNAPQLRGDLGLSPDPSLAFEGVVNASDLVLTPASCYPLYPIAAQDAVPLGGLLFDVRCDCFRAEPSLDFDRLQSFRMREFVCIGSPEEAQSFQKDWMARSGLLMDALGLTSSTATANDPFFGGGTSFLKAQQRALQLKFELLVPVISDEKRTACMSFNYHRDHFGITWDIKRSSGDVAHTACVAFGMDRLVRALFVEHGLDIALWPNGVRQTLSL